ncbi:MAG: GNAT family acetyltransferase [bacterium]
MLIRAYVDADEPDVTALWDAVFPESRPWNQPRATLARQQAVQPEMLLVGERDGRVVATVIAGYDGVRGWIYHLAVLSAARGAGAGSAMMRAAERALAARGCAKVNLQVRADNADVVRFYERLGYQVEPRVSLGKVLGVALIAARPYVAADLEPALDMWRRSKRAAFPYVALMQAHTLDDDRSFFRDHLAARCLIELAEIEGRIVGLLAQCGAVIDQLFVDVDWQRRGVGALLLDAAKQRAPGGLRLSTFQRNAGARAFYERHGFIAVRFGVSPAPENEPDVEYRWPGAAC